MKTLSAVLYGVFFFCIPISYQETKAQSWSIDPLGSSVSIDGVAHADDGIPPNGGPDHQIGNANGLGIAYAGGAGVHEFGTDLYVVANDASAMTESGLSYVVVDGQLSNTLVVEWRAYAQPEILDGGPGYLGNATVDLDATIEADLTNLIPGALYKISFEWEYRVDAQANHDAILEDPETASASLNFDLGGGGPGFVYNQAVDSNDGVFPDLQMLSGNGLFYLNAAATPEHLQIILSADATAKITPPLRPIAGDDRADAAGYGKLKIVAERVVPEPGTITLVLIGAIFAAVLGLRKRK